MIQMGSLAALGTALCDKQMRTYPARPSCFAGLAFNPQRGACSTLKRIPGCTQDNSSGSGAIGGTIDGVFYPSDDTIQRILDWNQLNYPPVDIWDHSPRK